QLTGRVDFSLEGVLALTQHRGRIQRVPVGTRKEVGRFEENARALLPRQSLPSGFSLESGFSCLSDLLSRAIRELTHYFSMRMRHHHFAPLGTANLTAADHSRNIGFLRSHLLQAGLEASSRGFPRGIGANRLVAWHWDAGDLV